MKTNSRDYKLVPLATFHQAARLAVYKAVDALRESIKRDGRHQEVLVPSLQDKIGLDTEIYLFLQQGKTPLGLISFDSFRDNSLICGFHPEYDVSPNSIAMLERILYDIRYQQKPKQEFSQHTLSEKSLLIERQRKEKRIQGYEESGDNEEFIEIEEISMREIDKQVEIELKKHMEKRKNS